MIRPSGLAVLRLNTSSKRVGCSTANSPGFAPFRIQIDVARGTAVSVREARRVGHGPSGFGELLCPFGRDRLGHSGFRTFTPAGQAARVALSEQECVHPVFMKSSRAGSFS